MAKAFLHIGTMKSGSTFLQLTCAENRSVLRQAGIRFFGMSTRTAVLDLKRASKLPEAHVGDWPKFAAKVRATPSDVLISNELLFPIPAETIRQVVAALGSHELRVIVTLRDVTKLVSSHWQERAVDAARGGWTEYCKAVCSTSRNAKGSQGFWAAYDVVPVMARWLELLSADRFTVVVVPPSRSDPRLLWDRFLTAINVPGNGTTLAAYSNPTMGAISTQLVEDVAAQLKGLPSFDRRRTLRKVLAKRILTQRSSSEPAFRLTPAQQAVLKARAIEMADGIRAAGVQVIGDLDDMIPADEPAPGIQPDEITDSQLLEAAVFGLAEMCRQMARDQAEITALKDRAAPER